MGRRLLLVVVALAAVVAVGLIARSGTGDGSDEVGATAAPEPTTAPEPTQAPSPSPVEGVPGPPAEAVPMYVRYVCDGDTVKLQNEAPNELVTTPREIDVRLIGVDTPEAKPTPECFAQEATDFLRALLPQDTRVLVAPDRDSWDDYQRRLFYVWTPDGRFVNYELVAGGFAEAIRVWPNVAQTGLLQAAQERARAESIGRWGRC